MRDLKIPPPPPDDNEVSAKIAVPPPPPDDEGEKKKVSQPPLGGSPQPLQEAQDVSTISESAAPSSSAKTPFEQFKSGVDAAIKGKEVSAMGFEIPKDYSSLDAAKSYEQSQKELVGAQKGVDWATRRDEELKGSLDPEARKSAGKYTQDAAIKLGHAQFKADENIVKLKEAIKGDLDYLGSNLENFTRKSEEEDVIADEVKIDEYAREQARKKGLPEDGYYKNFLYNNAKAEVAQKIIEPDVLKEREKLFKEKTGKSIEDAFGEDFTKGFTKAQEIEATAKTQINSVAQEVNALAKTETEEIAKGVNSQIEQLNAAYQQQAAQVTDQSQADALYQEYTANFNRLQANFLDAQNQINGKYNQRLRRQADEIEKVANQKWSEEAEKYKKDYKVSPDLLEQLKSVSQEAYKKVVNSKEKVKEVRDLYTPAISNYYRSTVSSLGRSLGNLSETMGYDYGKVLGDYMENTYQVGSAELNSWKDLLDASKLAKSAGQLTGAMLPSMGAAAATTIATQGLGAPEAISMLAGGLAAWTGESMDMAGNIERETFAATGDANKALERSKRMWDAQMAIMPLYSLEMLPFMKGFGLSKNLGKRMLGGAAVEFGTEVGQEYIQNRAETTINADKEFSEIFDTASWKEFGHTALNVAPVMILGAGGQIRGEKSEQEKINDEAKSFALKTKFSEIAPDQLNQFMADMVSQKGATFTSAYISNLYTNGKIDKAQANDLVKSMGVAAEVQQKAKEYGFDETQQKVFTAFKFKLQNAQQQAANETDPILKQAAEAKVKELEEQTVNFASGKQADYIVMTYPNGEQYVLSVGQGQSAAKNPKIQQAVADGAIKLEGSGKGVEVVNSVGENIKANKKAKVEAEKAGLVAETGQAIQERIYIQNANYAQKEKQDKEQAAIENGEAASQFYELGTPEAKTVELSTEITPKVEAPTQDVAGVKQPDEVVSETRETQDTPAQINEFINKFEIKGSREYPTITHAKKLVNKLKTATDRLQSLIENPEEGLGISKSNKGFNSALSKTKKATELEISETQFKIDKFKREALKEAEVKGLDVNLVSKFLDEILPTTKQNEEKTPPQVTPITGNQQQPSKGKAKGAVRATEKPVPVTDKEAKKQAREAKKQQEEELKKRKKDLANAEPNDIKQLILQYFYGGGRILTEDFKNETGFGTRGGQQDKVRAFKEFKKRIWAHSGKSPSMDDLVMQFQDEWKANYGSAEDQQAIRNEIIGVLKDFDSKSQIERELERLFSVGGKIVTSRDERNQSQQEEDLMQRYAPESAEEAAQMEAWEAMNRSQQDFVMEDDYTAYLLGRVDEMTEEEAQEYLDNEEKYNQLIKQENENYERESKTNAKDSSATTGQAKAAKEYEAELAELNKKLKDAEKAKRDKLDRISGKVDLFADEAKANELFGAEQNLSAENIAKQLKPETDKIAKLEAEKAAFEANKENYLKKYDNQSEISEAAPEKVLTEKEKAAKELADRIRKKKWGGANVVFDFGLTKTIYNFAVDKVADAVESGTELGKAIQQAVEWIESQMNGKEWDKKGFSDSFSDEGNDGKVPPTEKEGEPESAEGKTKKHILGLRVENSELIPEEIRKGLLEKGIEYIQKGVKVSQKEAQQIVDAYEKQGDLDGLADYVMNPLNRIEGDVKVALEQELYKKYAEKAGKATSEEEKAEYRKRTIDILYAAQKTGAEAGRAVNMQKAWQDIAGRDPQGIVAAYKREIEERNEPFLAKHEPSIKSAFEQLQDLLETEEGQQLIKEQIEKEVEAQVEAITEPLTTERRKKADKAIAAIKGFRNKIKANSYSDAVGIVAAVDTALGIIEKAIDKGASVADAIERGVRYVNKKMNGKAWNEAQFRKDIEQGFKDAGIEITEKEKKVSKIKDAATRLKGKSKDLDALIKDPAKALEELENKKVAAEKRAKERESKSEEVKALEVEIKLKKKLVRLIQSFAALTDKQKKDIISETLDFIVKNGYLSEAEFRNIFAKSIGLDHLTAQDEARILELSEIISKVKDAADKLSENPTPENVENFKKAFWEARKANEKLSGYFREKKSFLEFWSTAIRGSLLTPATGVLSFATNLVQTPIMLSEYATSTALDYIRYNLAKIDLLNKKFPNLFDKKQSISAGAFYSNYLPSMWSGLKEGAKQMWTGSMPESISDREMKGSLHPSDNFMKVWNSLSGKEKQSFVDNLQDSAEFLLGVPAETMFRILNLTDKPFRRGIEGGVLSELIELDLAQKKKQIEAKPVKSEADLAMLDEINSGREKTRLLTNPPEELMAKAEQEGLEGVFQDKHMITKLLEAASQRFKSEMKSRKGEKNMVQTYLKGLLSVFKTTQFPYINMPANFLSLIIKYSNPVIPAMSAMFKLNKGDVRGAQKEMAAVVTSLIIGKVAEFLIVNGLATGAGDDDDEKKRSIKREGQPANTFNLSAFLRLKAGGNPNYQAGDYCVRYNQLGVAGVVVNTYANVYEMKGKKAFEQLDWTEKYINLTFSGGRTGLDQSMVSGTSALIDAFSSTNEYKFNRWATQTVKAIMSPIIPNTATKVIAATDRDNLLKNTREDDLVTWVKNNMKAQLGLDNDLPNFITIWGEKAKKTPTDRNAWMYQLFDFTKGAPTNQDYVASEIYKLWKSQYDIDKEYGTNLANSIIPEVIPKKIKLNGIEQKLTPSQHEELSILVGKNRKVLVSNYINGNIITYNDKGQPVNINWDEELNEKKADRLNKIYENGYKQGLAEFKAKYGYK